MRHSLSMERLSPLQGRPHISGKGRFGKRPSSFTLDCGGNSSDNSNDSGLECDFRSESQLSWCSSEDSQFSRASTTSIPALLNSSRGELIEELTQDSSSQLFDFIANSSQTVNVASTLSFEKSRKHLLSGTTAMSPDSTAVGVPSSPFSQVSRMNNTFLTGSLSQGTVTTSAVTQSPVPMKRPKFSFSSPTSVKGLKLRNQNQNPSQNGSPVRTTGGKRLPQGTNPTLATSSLSPTSSDRRAHLQILCQPEEQHRARYQTEGSRGAIKDRKSNGFPTVKLTGYDKPATLQIFIGTDQGKVSPHMFYQACKVTGKSSTPCIEKKVEGTVLIEIEFEPSKDMVIGCDCVGILKERNVDVEQRFPFHHASQSRKKSTKCRMIFRTTIVNSMGVEETLQAASLPILCTQPPGLPEVCKQSLTECPAKGGLELFLIGKNFLKDTKALFQEEDAEGRVIWEAVSEPQKDFLQQNHAICTVPPYKDENIQLPVECKVSVVSGGKQSEPHRFTYFPNVTPANYRVSNCSPCVPTTQDQGQSPQLNQTSVEQTLTSGQQMETTEIQNGVGMLTSGSERVVNTTMSNETSAATITGLQLCPSLTSVPLEGHLTLSPTNSVMEPLPSLSFDTNMIPTTTQESQVVNELRSILEQSVSIPVSTHNSNEQTAELISSSNNAMMEMKSEIQFPVMNLDHNMNATEPMNTESGVPLDLQFPPQVTATTTASEVIFTDHSRIHSMNPFQQPNNSEMNLTQMLNRSMGSQVTTTMEQTLISPGASVVRSFGISPLSSRRVQSMPNVNGNIHSINENINLVADCLGHGIMKTEPISPINVTIPVGVEGSQISPPPVTNVSVMNFLVGEFQQQGPMAKTLSSMSDNELINYINPSCFDQGAII